MHHIRRLHLDSKGGVPARSLPSLTPGFQFIKVRLFISDFGMALLAVAFYPHALTL